MLLSIALRFYFFNEYLDNKYSLNDLVWAGNDQLYIHLYNFMIGVFLYHCRNIKIKIHSLLVYFLMVILLFIGYVESDLITGINEYREWDTQYSLLLGYLSILILALIVFAFLDIELNKVCYRIVSFISLVSYSLYLYHFPVLHYIESYNFSWYIFLPIFLLISFFVAGISYYLIEAPFLRYASIFNKK